MRSACVKLQLNRMMIVGVAVTTAGLAIAQAPTLAPATPFVAPGTAGSPDRKSVV